MNERQILRNIAHVCLTHPEKMTQLETVRSITFDCTSDDEVQIVSELYNNNICRVRITGTRSRMTATYNTLSMELCRKKWGEIPWCAYGFRANCNDILSMIDELIMFPGGSND